MIMNKDGVSDDGLVARLSEHCKLKWMTLSKIDGHDYQMVPLDLLHEAIGELARRAADSHAPAVVTEEIEKYLEGQSPNTQSGGVYNRDLREALADAALSVRAEPVAVNYAETVAPYAAALRMVRDAIEELFGPTASLESEEAVLLRGPEPHHDAEALITALQRIRSALVASPADPMQALVEETGSENIENLRDMALVGHSLMEAIATVTQDGPYKNWAPADDPAEIVIDLYNDLVEARPAPSIPAGYRLAPEVPTPTHRHKKRGTEYVLIGIGKMQAEHWLDGRKAGRDSGGNFHVLSVDMHKVAIYQSVDDGSLWARPIEEWNDGRFEAIAAPAQQQEGNVE